MKYLKVFFISLLLLAHYHSPVVAEGPSFAEAPTAPDGPGSYYFTDKDDDPTYKVYMDIDHPLTKDLIDTAYVISYPTTEFLPEFGGDTTRIGNGEGWKWWSSKTVIDLGILDIFGSTALENDVILKTGQETVPAYVRINSSPADTYGNPFNENCFASGLSKEECLDNHQGVYESGLVNASAIGTPAQKLLPLEQQKNLLDDLAAQRLLCYSDNAPEDKDIECDNIYNLKEGVSSEDVAERTVNVSYEEYLRSPDEYQDIFAQKWGDGGLVPFAIVITDETIKPASSFLSNLFAKFFQRTEDTPEMPQVIMGWIPTIRGSAKNAKILRNTQLPLEYQEKNDQEISALLDKGIDWSGVDDIKDAFIKKAEDPHMEASTSQEDLQHTGAIIETKPDNQTVGIPAFFDLKNEKAEDGVQNKSVPLYKITFVLPKQIIERSEYIEALSKTLLPHELTNFPDSFLEIPINSPSSNTPRVSEEDVHSVETPCKEDDIPDGNGKCYKEVREEVASIEWRPGEEIKSGIAPERETARTVYISHQATLPKDHAGYFTSTCIFNELKDRIPGFASMINSSSERFDANLCPDNLQVTTP